MKVKSGGRLGRIAAINGPSQCPVVVVFPNATDAPNEHVECFKVDGMPYATYPQPLEMKLREAKSERWVVISVGSRSVLTIGEYVCKASAEVAAKEREALMPHLHCYAHKLEV